MCKIFLPIRNVIEPVNSTALYALMSWKLTSYYVFIPDHFHCTMHLYIRPISCTLHLFVSHEYLIALTNDDSSGVVNSTGEKKLSRTLFSFQNFLLSFFQNWLASLLQPGERSLRQVDSATNFQWLKSGDHNWIWFRMSQAEGRSRKRERDG